MTIILQIHTISTLEGQVILCSQISPVVRC